MGLERMGVSAAETGGWSTEQSAAFEEHLHAYKFNLFAVSRAGARTKANKFQKPTTTPSTAPAPPLAVVDEAPVADRSVDPESASHWTAGASSALPTQSASVAVVVEYKSSDSGSGADVSGSGEDEDRDLHLQGGTADPRLAGKSLHSMVDYYYNVWLTRPETNDDNDDRSDCGDNDEPQLAAGVGAGTASASGKKRGRPPSRPGATVGAAGGGGGGGVRVEDTRGAPVNVPVGGLDGLDPGGGGGAGGEAGALTHEPARLPGHSATDTKPKKIAKPEPKIAKSEQNIAKPEQKLTKPDLNANAGIDGSRVVVDAKPKKISQPDPKRAEELAAAAAAAAEVNPLNL